MLAATRLIPMRKNKGKSIGACLHNHTSYIQNPDKTEQGELVSSYQCSPLTVDEEFLLTKRLYEQTTGRSQKSDVIAYIKTYKAGGRDVLTVEEQRKVETIEVEGKNISSLRGIEAFPNLTELKCGNNSIQKLDLRQNPKLKTLKCNKNHLTQLNLSKNPDIDYLNCSENQLEQLDVSHLKDLVTLNCSHNDLEQLDVRNSKFLETLYCSSNRLTELDADVAHKSRLVSVECQNNQLTSLILGQNKLLKKLNCANNQLTQLNLRVFPKFCVKSRQL